MIGLGKEIDDIRDARLESERNTRTLLDESRKENDCVSAITFRLRIESKKWNDNAARYGCDESGGKENVEMSCLSSRPYEIIDFFIGAIRNSFSFSGSKFSKSD